MKGCICLDIDGTLTSDTHSVPEPVVRYLRLLYERGWQFLFATGRTYSFALKTLDRIDFPFFFSVQNGADLLRMPEGALLDRAYLSAEVIPLLEAITEGEEEDFLVYAGFEHGDFCYYRPKNFSPKFLDHIEIVKRFAGEPWQEVERFSFPKERLFPLIKCLSSPERALPLYQKIKEIPGVEVSCIKDPVSDSVYLNLITALRASKGEAVRNVRSLFPEGTLFIAAGDDRNDLSMLEEADLSIAMSTGPDVLLGLADILARPASEMGLIEALKEATGERE